MHKVRIYPTEAQKATIKSWLGATRWTYNRVVAYLNDPETKDCRTIKDLRTHSVNDEMIKMTKKEWIGSIPYDIRDEGLRDARKAVGSNLAKQRIRKKRGLSHAFKLKYRHKKRAHQESIVLHSKHWQKSRGLYFDLLGSSGAKLKSSEPLPIVLAYDMRLFRTRLDEYFLCVPQAPKIRGDNQVTEPEGSSTVALDPGVRTFMTAYDASGSVVEWGVGDTTRIHRLCHTLDKLEKSWKDVNHRKRYKLQRAALKIRRKIRRLVDELHRKLIQWLCNNFRVVLIPTFETQQMVRRGHRRLNSKTAKMMCTWSHFRFRTNLALKAKTFPCKVIETTEEFTSKTCGMCGTINNKLGGKKTFTCQSHNCGFRSDRDFNGARNILIRHLTVTRAGQ
jgi:putative transposase